MKLWQRPFQSSPLHQVQFPVVLVLLFLGTRYVSCVINYTQGGQPFQYKDDALLGLQQLWTIWNETPDPASNLAGWSADPSHQFPCRILFADEERWRGVQCTWETIPVSNSISLIDVHIIGLSLSDANIIGTLPGYAIFNLAPLATLELTGNPNLTGPLPDEFDYLFLSSLDVHDNAFNGGIPQWNSQWNLLYLDLSGNQFTGPFPSYQVQTMVALEVLKLGRNQMEGGVLNGTFGASLQLETLDISNNKFSGDLPNFTNNTKLKNLNCSGNNFIGDITNLTAFMSVRNVLAVVDLSYNQLSLPTNLQNWRALEFGSIEELYLDGNEIKGVLDVTQILKDQSSARLINDSISANLRILSLKDNKIMDVKYDKSSIRNGYVVFRLQGNPYCMKGVDSNDGKRCFCTQTCFNTPAATSKIRRKIIIISTCSSVATMILILSIVMVAIFLNNRRYKQDLYKYFQKQFDMHDIKPTIYSYIQLRVATSDFHKDNKLGQGGYGAVFKGVLPSGQVVAVKQLFMKTKAGLDEFSNEIVLISGMKHRNLVNLKGCCLRESARILVYEYVDNLDVDQILLGPARQVVSWAVRLKICLGVARGLNYLHADARPRVIHRDIKASNILLDKNMEPKIADFGLALLFPEEKSHIMTVHVAGTQGYLAPEYASRGHVSDKVDVYSFGILVLEIICGRWNIDASFPPDQIYICDWAWKLYEENRVLDLVDPSLQFHNSECINVERVLILALQCIQNAGERRPSMAHIVSVLHDLLTSSDVTVLSGAGDLRQSYESRKSLHLDSSGFSIVSEKLSFETMSLKNLHKRRGENLTIEEELNEINAI